MSDFLHLPKGTTDLQKTHFPAYTPKITGTSEQARKSLIINRKTCSVTRTTIEQPEQKTELSTGWASFKQTVNDRPLSLAKKLNDGLIIYLSAARLLINEASADASFTNCLAHAVRAPTHARALK